MTRRDPFSLPKIAMPEDYVAEPVTREEALQNRRRAWFELMAREWGLVPAPEAKRHVPRLIDCVLRELFAETPFGIADLRRYDALDELLGVERSEGAVWVWSRSSECGARVPVIVAGGLQEAADRLRRVVEAASGGLIRWRVGEFEGVWSRAEEVAERRRMEAEEHRMQAAGYSAWEIGDALRGAE